MSQARLFYGPGAQQAALDAASRIGRLIHAPMGYDPPDKTRKGYKYLNVEDARTAATLLQSTPVGVQVGVVILGPMDRAAPLSADVLLKSIEDHDGTRVVPILWAFDLDSVRPTIRSRLLAEFCPGTEEDRVPVLDMTPVVRDALSGRLGQAIVTLLPLSGKEGDVLTGMAEALMQLGTPEALSLWLRLRPLTLMHAPLMREIVLALMEEPHDP